MRSDEIIGMLRSYVNKSLVGVGAIKGAPCKIQSITDSDGSHTITFSWLDDAGTTHTSQLIVNDGSNIDSITQDGADITITLTDGTSYEFTVPTVQGPKGDKGDKGDAGEGLPEGGTAGQVLVKKSSTDYDMEWDTLSIPSKTSDLTNDSGFITKVVNDLVNYYLKSETYSKTEVDDIVTAIKNSRFEVVATLPTTDIKTNVIYLVPKDPAQTSNVKDEYINLDGTTTRWEKIGDTEIDLSNYVTTQALNTALSAYTTTADLTTLLAAKQDTLTFDNAPTENSNNPVKSGGVKTYVDGAIADLDVSDSAVAGSYVTAVSETDGAISVTREASDSVPTEDSTKMVQSGGVYTDTQNVYKANGVLGAKNLLPYPYYSGDSYTVNGVTFIVNDDLSVTANGTATNNAIFLCRFREAHNLKAGTYRLNGCPSGGSTTSYYQWLGIWDGSTNVYGVYDTGNGVNAVITEEYEDYYLVVGCYVYAGQTVSDLTFYPMLRLATDTDDTYQPYAKTNLELTVDAETLTNAFANNVNVNGSKNLLVLTSYSIGETVTLNQGTVKANDDGSYTINGTFSADASYKVDWLKSVDRRRIDIIGLAGKEVIASCKGSPNSNIQLYTGCFKTDGTASQAGTGGYGDVERTWTMPNDAYTFRNWISIAAGSYSNVTIYPMVRLATDDNSFATPSKTNIQLTQDTTALLDNLEVNGAVNLLDSAIATQVVNDVTVTNNGDGSYTVNCSSTSHSSVSLISTKKVTLLKGTYKWTASNDGESAIGSNDCYAFIRGVNGTVDWYRSYGDTGYHYGIITLTQDSEIEFGLCVAANATVSNLTFKPMLTVASYNGDYVPYAKSNRELTEELTVEDHWNEAKVSGYDYFSGSYLKKYGKVVNLSFSIAQTLTAGQTVKVLELPVGCRPAGNTIVPVYQNGTQYGTAWYKTDGDVTINPTEDKNYLGFSATFIAGN